MNANNRIYISGRITGLKRPEYLANFAKAEEELKMQGFVVLNPAKVNDTLPACMTWEEYMEVSMTLLKMCKRIYLLKNWRESKGAKAEWNYATMHDYEVIEE